MRTRMIAAAAGLLALIPLATASAAASASTGNPAAVTMTSAGIRVVTLPTGQRVAIYGPPGAPTSFGPPPGVTWPADNPIAGFAMNGHLYAIPSSAAATLAGHLEDYDLTRLAGGPAAPVSRGPAVTSAAASSHNYWPLTVNPVPAPGAITFSVVAGLMNADDAAKFFTVTGIGPQGDSFSVPQGHYYLVAIFFGLENGQLVERTIVNPQFTVSAPTTVAIQASSASVQASASVSRPASLGLETMSVTRNALKNGGLGEDTISFGGAIKLLVNPTAPVNVGSLHYDSRWHFDSPDGGASYTYDLDYPANGVIPAQQDHPAPSDSALAAVDTHYASEVPGQTAGAGTTIVDLAGTSAMGTTFLTPIAVPGERTEYFTGAPDVHWQSSLVRANGSFEDWFSDAVRTYQPGSHVTRTWLRGPLVPGVQQFAQAPYAPLTCPACRQGDDINLIIQPYADSTGHVANQPTTPGGTPGDVASGSYTLSSGGTVLAAGNYPDGVQIPVPHAAARYQLRYDVTRSAPWWSLSTTTHTDWTFSSAPNTASLPPGWFCDFLGHTHCAVLPLLFASYQLPTDDSGHELAGPVTGEIDVSHLQGAPSPAVTEVTMQVSFDGGQTWRPAGVSTIAPGRYQVTYSNPPGATADIKVTARDTQGNSISQVIDQAYVTTSNG